MLYITGDTHGDVDMSNLSSRTLKRCCAEQNVDFHTITAAIVLGDFGLPWYDCAVDADGIHPTDKTDAYLLRWYNKKPFTILAVMGNHDNYDVIEKLPEVSLFGGTALKVSRNIFYLKRGEVYTIEGKRFLVLGGAQSEDKAWRVPHESWWQQEEWTEAERVACFETIRQHGSQFDYILSHTGTTEAIAYIEKNAK